jgi:predicted Zn finger-like uncharacterized protein
MIEIQCTSCHTRYRIDERVLPDDTPTFKCSRCGHVFSADPVPARIRKPAPKAVESIAQPARPVRGARPPASALKSPVESAVKRVDPRPAPEVRSRPVQLASADRREYVQQATPIAQERVAPPQPEAPASEPQREAGNDPLNRSFGDREEKPDTGESLEFVFSDDRNEIIDPPPEHELERPGADDDAWQVGEPSSEFADAPGRQAPTMIDEPKPAVRPAPAPVRRLGSPIQAGAPRFAPPRPPKAAGFQLGQTISDASDSVSAGTTHSSGFFLALFFFVAIGFFGASALISDEPAASARLLSQAPVIGVYFAQPIVPAMLVTLRDVRSQYYQLKGGHVALVISGNAQNVGARPLHLIEIDANLVGDGSRPLASQTVYCGNELSAKMLGEMTPREIEFSQGLSPQKAFVLNPSGSAPFLMVFVDPPEGAGKVRISVSKAAPLESSAPSMPPA